MLMFTIPAMEQLILWINLPEIQAIGYGYLEMVVFLLNKTQVTPTSTVAPTM